MTTTFCADIPGFPEDIGERIELPDIAELLVMPMFSNVSADDLRKYGTDFQRELLDKTPIRNTTKHVAVKSFVQFLYPEIGACDIKIDPKYQNEWHIDYDLSGDDVFWHIITSECTSRTEFNVNPLYLECPSDKIRAYLNANADKLGLEGRKIDAERFCTFTSHIHRPAPPLKPEFRFFFRVQETSFKAPEPIERARMVSSEGRFGGTTVHRDGKTVPNLAHDRDGIKIYYPWGGSN